MKEKHQLFRDLDRGDKFIVVTPDPAKRHLYYTRDGAAIVHIKDVMRDENRTSPRTFTARDQSNAVNAADASRVAVLHDAEVIKIAI